MSARVPSPLPGHPRVAPGEVLDARAGPEVTSLTTPATPGPLALLAPRKVHVRSYGISRSARTTEEFAQFVEKHGRGLGRLAYLLLGDDHAAEDLTAEVFLAAWRQWDRVHHVDYPLAYLRQVMVNLAATQIQRVVRERNGLERLHRYASASGTHEPDGAAVMDVRTALRRLPPRRRACLVLRYAFDLAEREVAALLGISVGTVKSQTSKAVEQFRREIGDALVDTRTPDAVDRVDYWLGGR